MQSKHLPHSNSRSCRCGALGMRNWLELHMPTWALKYVHPYSYLPPHTGATHAVRLGAEAGGALPVFPLLFIPASSLPQVQHMPYDWALKRAVRFLSPQPLTAFEKLLRLDPRQGGWSEGGGQMCERV